MTALLITLGLGATVRVIDAAGGGVISCRPLPAIMIDILSEDGLMPCFRRHRNFVSRGL